MSIARRILTTVTVLVCVLVLVLAVQTATAEAAVWSDLPDSLLTTYGLSAEDLGEMSNGYPDGTWRPYEYATRGQFVSLALRYFNIAGAWRVQQHFSDVPLSSSQYLYVEKAFEIGLVRGYQSFSDKMIFGFYDHMTREQVATILTRYLSKMEPEKFAYATYTAERCNEILASFADQDQVQHIREVAMALDHEVILPAGDRIMPRAGLTRIQAAALIVRAQNTLTAGAPPDFPDGGPFGNRPLTLLRNDAWEAGILVDSGHLGAPAPWLPIKLSLGVQTEVQNSAAYEETAAMLLSLAENYQERMKYEQVRLLFYSEDGTWLYDKTFETPLAADG